MLTWSLSVGSRQIYGDVLYGVYIMYWGVHIWGYTYMGIYIEDSERPGTDANGMRESEKETCKETYKAANHTH